MKSNDSPEIQDRGETTDISGLPSGQPQTTYTSQSVLTINRKTFNTTAPVCGPAGGMDSRLLKKHHAVLKVRKREGRSHGLRVCPDAKRMVGNHDVAVSNTILEEEVETTQVLQTSSMVKLSEFCCEKCQLERERERERERESYIDS